MTKQRKPSAALTTVLNNLDEDLLRHTRDRMLIAAKIADTLRAKGISQKRFAEMMGRSKSEISEWLSGDRNFTIDTLSDIMNCLGIDLLNISMIRLVPVSKDEPKRKIVKKRAPVVYEMNDTITSPASSNWLAVPDTELSVAL